MAENKTSKREPSLDDAAMLEMLDKAKELYADGAILEAATMARSFASKIAAFECAYRKDAGASN